MSVRAEIADGPHAGNSYRMTYPPERIYLPIWPEPDEDGPPYPYAMYEKTVDPVGVRYKYVETQAP